ncbi:MAG: ribbon-helix-helix protein, CopG family, partial [Luteibaculum sp.]
CFYFMATFTSSLPDNLLRQLSQKAQELKLPKNKLIERALSIYLDQLNRAEYIKSYREMAKDADVLSIAEEGMEDYCKNLSNLE